MSYPAKAAYQDPLTAADYDEQRFTSAWGRIIGAREIRTMIQGLDSLGIADALIIDAPAGTGRLTHAASRPGRRVIAMDISLAMLASGLKSRQLNGNAQFLGAVVGDLETLPIKSASIDAAACLRLMGHLPYQHKKHVVSELLRVSRVGIVIMFATRTRLLTAKRRLLIGLRLRRKPAAWFDETDDTIRKLIAELGGRVTLALDVMGPFAESRAYVIRKAS